MTEMDIIFLFNDKRDSPDPEGIEFLYDIGVFSKVELPLIVPTLSYQSDPKLDFDDFKTNIKQMKEGKFSENLMRSFQIVFDCSLGKDFKKELAPREKVRKFHNTPKTIEKILNKSESFIFVSEQIYYGKESKELIYDPRKQFIDILEKGTLAKVESVDTKIKSASTLLLFFMLDVLSQNFSSVKNMEKIFNDWKGSLEKKKTTFIEKSEIDSIDTFVNGKMEKLKVKMNSIEIDKKKSFLRKEKIGDLLNRKLKSKITFFRQKLKMKSEDNRNMAQCIIEMLEQRCSQIINFLGALDPENETHSYLNTTFLKFPSAVFSGSFGQGFELKKKISEIIGQTKQKEHEEKEINTKTILEKYPYPLGNENRKKAEFFQGDFDEMFKNRLNNKSKFRYAQFLRNSEFSQKSTLKSQGNLTLKEEKSKEFNFFTVDYENKKIQFELKEGVLEHLKLIEETVEKFRYNFQDVKNPALYPIFIPSKVLIFNFIYFSFELKKHHQVC
jgi:hypothetical protein